VRHEAAKWRFEAALRLRGDPARVTHNRYEIEPFAPGARSTHWTSTNPALGALTGRFVHCGDTNHSFYASTTGSYSGFESQQKQPDSTY
jgi:hypothetical protein